MTRKLKQLWLLLQKNLIVTKRAIAWTIFEIALPIGILLIVTLLFVLFPNRTQRYEEKSFPSTPITGNADDVSKGGGAACALKIAYCSNSPGLDDFMKLFAARYGGLANKTEIERFVNKDQMLIKLKNDSVAGGSIPGRCLSQEYVGGVLFKTYNTTYLDYQILMPDSGDYNYRWQLNKFWESRECSSRHTQDLPGSPPYWSSRFLSIQHALDSSFIQFVNIPSTSGRETFQVELQRMPESVCLIRGLADFWNYLPSLWAISLFCTVLHSGREVAQEKQAMKTFLSVMGLQTSMFYLSHVLFSWMKSAFVIFICAMPLAWKIEEVNAGILLITFLLYGLGAVSFAMLCAAPFKSPNRALKAIMLMWTISAGVGNFVVPPLDDLLYCFLAALNINHAFKLALNVMAQFMRRGRFCGVLCARAKNDKLGFSNLFVNGTTEFTLGYCIIMMMVDVFLMLALTVLIDKCVENSDWSFWSMFRKDNNNPDALDNANSGGDHEAASGILGTVSDIEIEDVIKVWSATGERAVDGLNLKAYRGQVAVLLGHNGAGKSTTFSMLAGLVKPTSGKIMICEENVSNCSDRANIGYCPQVVDGDYSEEAEMLISDLKLLPKQNELSMNLSGGMKRKLCVCMALIGGSRVVLLDEPTAGMDPGARYDVEQLMDRIKGDRTILLTTHYMDEAERLGDRIFIMANGRIVCSGSTNFLKRRIGSGYTLTIVARDDVDASALATSILEIARGHVQQASSGAIHGKQLEIKLPKDQQHRFSDLFAQLEHMQEALGISRFGLSLNSLEQVFLKVGEEIDKKNGKNTEIENTARVELIESQKSDRYTGFTLRWSQFVAVLYKRLLFCIRKWPQLITQIILPVFVLMIVSWMSKTNDVTDLSLSIERLRSSRVFYQNNASGSSVSKAYRTFIESFPNKKVVDWNNDQRAEPTTWFGALFNSSSIKVLFNYRALHSLPVSLNAVNNARLRAVLPAGSMKTSIFVYSTFDNAASKDDNDAYIFQLILALVMIVLLSLVTSIPIVFLVSERSSKFLHQQSLTGVSPITFWVGSFLFDLSLFVISCTSFLIVFMVAKWQQDSILYLALLWILYFLASTPFIYIVSLIFTSPSKAYLLLVILQIFAPFLAILIPEILRALFGLLSAVECVYNVVEIVLLLFIPAFCLGKGVVAIFLFSHSDRLSKLNIMHWYNLGKPVICMSVFAVVATIFFVAFQFKFVQQKFYKLWNWRSRRVNHEATEQKFEEDDDVRRERAQVEESFVHDNYSMIVQGLTKKFDGVCALDNLTLGVKRRECFGLLGVNGAGKTTAFDILTGRAFPTFGSATLDGRDVVDQIAIGYCPQFDAIMMDFTGREILKMLARLHGFINFKEKGDIVLRAVGMEAQGNKLIKYYSGGQRRKISVAIALLSVTKMIILDEPTAGIDPKARRHIWNVLSTVRDKSDSAQLLTSHSMDECEALCSRIAVLNKGRMIAIGTSQWLKSKFGNKFTLTIVAATVETRDHIIRSVGNIFPGAVLKTDTGSSLLTLNWQISQTKKTGLVTDCWSKMFSQCHKLATDLKATDFCLSQSSLEETFLSLTKRTQTS